MITAAFVLHYPYDFENPSVPDERINYGWAQLYNEGKYAVPIEDWFGGKTDADISVLGDEYGIFVDASFRDLDGKGARMPGGEEILENDIEAYVYDANGTPVARALVIVAIGEDQKLEGLTDINGSACFFNLPIDKYPGYPVVALYKKNPADPNEPTLNARTFLRLEGFTGIYTYFVTTELYDADGDGIRNDLDLRVSDTLNTSISNADVYLDGKSVGETDENGQYSLRDLSLGPHHIHVEKKGEAPAVFGGMSQPIIESDGGYYLVNEKAPGYAVLLGWFAAVGLHGFLSTLLMLIASISTYFLARRLYHWPVAVMATAFVMTSAIGVMIVYERGMADYSTMAFAVLGMWLFVESIHNEKWLLSSVFGFLGGLSLAAAVAMRYSTLLLLLAPFILLLLITAKTVMTGKSYRFIPTDGGSDNKMPRLGLSISIKFLVKKGLPFLMGLMVFGLLIASYNNTYFGSPFVSGYSYDEMVRFNINATGNGTSAEIIEPSYTSPADYFVFTSESVSNLPRIFSQLIQAMLVIILLPLGLWMEKRRILTVFFLVWILSNFSLYITYSWIGRAYLEDMRYFLPSLPAIGIMASYALYVPLKKSDTRRMVAVLIVLMIVGMNFVVSARAIDYQLERLERGGATPWMKPQGDDGQAPPEDQQPPPDQDQEPPPSSDQTNNVYKTYSISQLLTDPLAHEGEQVQVLNATVTRVLRPEVMFLEDGTTSRNITLHLEDNADAPPLSLGDKINISGIFRPGYTNHQQKDPMGEWEVNIRDKNYSNDKVEKL